MSDMKSASILSCFKNWFLIIYKKGFVLHENNASALINVNEHVKQTINVKHIYINDFVTVWYIEITFKSNTLKSIIVCTGLKTEFSSTYYNDKGDLFGYIIGEYINPYMKGNDHPALFYLWEINLDTSE